MHGIALVFDVPDNRMIIQSNVIVMVNESENDQQTESLF